MSMYIDILEKTVNELIRKKEGYKGLELKYILINDNDYKKTEAVFSDDNMKEAVIIYVFDNEKIIKIPEWSFNYDDNIYGKLSNGYQIGMLSDDMHYSVWDNIFMNYPDYIENLSGVRRYADYCKENGITNKYLETKFGGEIPNVLGYFEEIYIRNKDEHIIMSEKMYKKQKEIEYLKYILAYDFLKDKLIKGDKKESKVNYKFCDDMINEFMASEIYRNKKESNYEILKKWVSANSTFIEEYLYYISKNLIKNNLKILERGHRNEQTIALVERKIGNNIEYIVAFNYMIENEELSWGHGSYYGEDKERALHDYENVIAGEYLTNDYKAKKKDIERM